MIKKDNDNGEWCSGICKPFTKKATTFFKAPPKPPIPTCDRCKSFAENLVLMLEKDSVLANNMRKKINKAKASLN